MVNERHFLFLSLSLEKLVSKHFELYNVSDTKIVRHLFSLVSLFLGYELVIFTVKFSLCIRTKRVPQLQ